MGAIEIPVIISTTTIIKDERFQLQSNEANQQEIITERRALIRQPIQHNTVGRQLNRPDDVDTRGRGWREVGGTGRREGG